MKDQTYKNYQHHVTIGKRAEKKLHDPVRMRSRLLKYSHGETIDRESVRKFINFV